MTQKSGPTETAEQHVRDNQECLAACPSSAIDPSHDQGPIDRGRRTIALAATGARGLAASTQCVPNGSREVMNLCSNGGQGTAVLIEKATN
jgi:hypothetical protein